MTRIAIIGGGAAGYHAAATWHDHQAESSTPSDTIIVFGDEPHQPYRRPMVNKGMLFRGMSASDVALSPALDDMPGVAFKADTPVESVDIDSHTLTAGGKVYEWDKLVFATGARPRLLDTDKHPWAAGRNVHYVRKPEHSEHLRNTLANLSETDNVVVVGGGVLGLEAAAGATMLCSAAVRILEVESTICARLLPPTAAEWLNTRHTDNNVTISCGIAANELNQRVEELDPAVIIVAVGAERNTELAEQAGIEVGKGVGGGIIVDGAGKTSTPDVWAIGDCVEIHADLGESTTIIRPEDDRSAKTMGMIVGDQLAEQPHRSYLDRPRSGYSRQYRNMLNFIGHTGLSIPAETSARYDEYVELNTADELIVFTIDPADNNTIVGVTTAGRSDEVRAAQDRIGSPLN